MPIFKTRAGGTGGSTATTTPIQDHLIDPLMSVGKPIAKGGQKAVMGVLGTAKKLKKAHKNWDGEEKTYDWDDQSQSSKVTTRGKDDGTTANGFKKDLARDDLEKGVHKGIKTVSGMGKSASKSMGGFGKVIDLAQPVTDAINPLKSASQILSGGHKAIKGGSEVYRFQKRKNRAREGQELAEAQNNPLAMGLKNTKRGLSSSRNESMVDTGMGVLEAGVGATGIGGMFDPTGITKGVNVALSGVNKIAKKGNLVRRAVKFGNKWEKVNDMRTKADNGDPQAMKWLLENDPRMGSSQLLMHSQEGSEESKSFAQEHVTKTLGLSEEGKQELATGSLGEFDKLYGNRTGQDIESQLGLKEAVVYNRLRPYLKKGKAMMGKIKGLFGGGKDKKQQGPQASQMSSNDIADQFTALTSGLDKEAELKKNKGGELSFEDQESVWGNVQGLNRESMPDRALPEVREYQKVKDFRIRKTHEELVDEAEQKSLKGRFTGMSDGKLFNMDQHATSEDAINNTILYNNEATSGTERAGQVSKNFKDDLAKTVGPYMKNSQMPEDIRKGLIAHEEKRRLSGQTAGKNLSQNAPTPQGWEQTQLDLNDSRKLEKIQAKGLSGDPKDQKKAAEKEKEHLKEVEERKKTTPEEFQKKKQSQLGKEAKWRKKEQDRATKKSKQKGPSLFGRLLGNR
jgi:hypothetical protein